MNNTDDIILMVDTKTKRPACVNLQAAFGCGESRGFFLRYFDAAHWLVEITPDMKKVKGTRDQWRALAEKLDKELLEKHNRTGT